MVELENKYTPSSRRFGFINWIGVWSLYKKEVLRFLIVIGQTIVGPIITAILFLLVISLAIGSERVDVLGVPYINFLFPGLIAMQVIQQSFSHSASSLLMGKVMGNIVDILAAPLSSAEVTISIILAAVTRSFVIAFVSIVVFSFILDFKIDNIYYVIIYIFLSSFFLGAAGFVAGLWAEKFDHMSTVTNFFIVPLSFLSGTFYTIEKLPYFLQSISKANPFFYMIDGFRFGFIGKSDGSITFGLAYLILLCIISWLVCYLLYKKGYKIKS
jgi:ABC-2 type transport system permease protein|tara:strand:+ start:16295 stop:17107 length:813 start_codon:yes stop_codon:yes gene_type:complete